MAKAKVEMSGLSSSAQREVNTVTRTMSDGGTVGGKALASNAEQEVRKASPRLNKAGQDSGGTLARGMEQGLIRNSPLIVAATSAALIGGAPAAIAGAGLLFGGIAAVALHNNEQVQHSWAALGDDLKTGAQQDAAVLVPVFTKMAQDIGAEFQRLRPLERQAFAAMEPDIEAVSGAITDFAQEAMPGAVRAVQASQPVFQALRTLAGDVGDGISGFLDNISAHAPAAGTALSEVGRALDIVLPAVGDLLGEGAELASDVLPPVVTVLGLVGDALHVVAPVLPEVAMGFLAVKAAGAVGDLLGKTATGLENIGAKAMVSVAGLTGLEGAGLAAGTGFEAAASGARGLETAMGPIGWIVAGISLVLPALIGGYDSTDEAQQKVAASAQSVTAALQESKGAITDNVRAAAAKYAQDAGLLNQAQQWGISYTTLIDALTGNKSALDAVTDASSQYGIQLQAQADAEDKAGKGTFGSITGAQALVAINDTQIKQLQSKAAANSQEISDQEALQAAISGASDAASINAQRLQGITNTASAANTQINLLKGALDALTGANMTADQAEIAITQSVTAVTDAISNKTAALTFNNGQLDLSNDKSATAAQLLMTLAGNMHQEIAVLEQQGASTDVVNSKSEALRQAFIKQAGQLGATADEAKTLADRYFGIPGQVHTEVTADTAQAFNATAALIAWINSRTASINVRANMPDLNGAVSGSGRMGTYAQGAIVHMFAGGGFEPMRGGVAQVVPPGTLRVIGDNPTYDEAYIPINNSARSLAILERTADRMGVALGGGAAAARRGSAPAGPQSVVGLHIEHATITDTDRMAARANRYAAAAAARWRP